MNEVNTARQIWHRFSRLPGSQHIARQYAVYGLIHWLRKVKPRSVVEVGAGIGTLTYTSLVALNDVHVSDGQPGFRLVTIENNAFCLEQLRQNLGGMLRQVEVIPDLTQLPASLGNVEFLIVDGGDFKETRYYANLAQGAVVFVESHRGDQRKTLTKVNAQRPFARARFQALDGYGRFWIYKFEPSFIERAGFVRVNVQTGMRILLHKILRRFISGEQMRSFYRRFSGLYNYDREQGLGQI